MNPNHKIECLVNQMDQYLEVIAQIQRKPMYSADDVTVMAMMAARIEETAHELGEDLTTWRSTNGPAVAKRSFFHRLGAGLNAAFDGVRR